MSHTRYGLEQQVGRLWYWTGLAASLSGLAALSVGLGMVWPVAPAVFPSGPLIAFAGGAWFVAGLLASQVNWRFRDD